MSTILRAIEFLGLSIWLGSDVFLSFVVAPGAFSVLASRDQAGAIVGYSLTRMHWMGIICGVVILLVSGLADSEFGCFGGSRCIVRGVDDLVDGDFAGGGEP